MSKPTKADPLIQKLFENKTNNAYPTVVVSGSGDAWFFMVPDDELFSIGDN